MFSKLLILLKYNYNMLTYICHNNIIYAQTQLHKCLISVVFNINVN